MHSDQLLFAALAAGAAWLATSILVPVVATFAVEAGAIDRPGGRKTHPGPVPRLGGGAVLLGWLLGTGLVVVLSPGRLVAWTGTGEVLALALAASMVLVVGIADDLAGLSVATKLAVELVGAGLLVWAGIGLGFSGTPAPDRPGAELLGGVVTVLWIVGVANATNMLDGLDGLAGGVIAVVAATLAVQACLAERPLTAVVLAGIPGACLAFLRHNWRGAIFLGDSGSLTLGFLLAVASVRLSLGEPSRAAAAAPLLALGIPVIDTLLVMARRFFGSPGVRGVARLSRVFTGDRNHLHHLLESWLGRRHLAVLAVLVMVSVSCVGSLAVAVTNDALLGLAVVAAETAAVVAARGRGFAARRADRADRGES